MLWLMASFHSLLPGGRAERYRYSVGYLWFRIFGSCFGFGLGFGLRFGIIFGAYTSDLCNIFSGTLYIYETV